MGTENSFLKNTAITFVFSAMIVGLAPEDVAQANVRHHNSGDRINHAKELLGLDYKKSAVRHSERAIYLNDFIQVMVKRCLPEEYKSQAPRVAKAVIDSSRRHGFDPIFVMAIIQYESSFNPIMEGSAGEIGLMQVKPVTAKWMAKLNNIPYDEFSLMDPVTNIRLGTAYMAKLRGQFSSRSQLYISAYNMGARRVREMVSDDDSPHDYVQAVMKRYLAMYSAFSVKGSIETKSIAAFAKLQNVTRAIASRETASVATN